MTYKENQCFLKGIRGENAMGDKLTTEELDYFLKGIKVQKILGKLPDGAGIPKYTRTTTDSIEVLDVGMKNLSSFSGDGFIVTRNLPLSEKS